MVIILPIRIHWKQSFKSETSREENDHEAPDELLSGRPETIKALVALEAQIQASGLEKSLIELVKTRASQINGCAYCINMHTRMPASTARPSSGCIC